MLELLEQQEPELIHGVGRMDRARSRRSGTPGPRPQTKGTPTCRERTSLGIEFRCRQCSFRTHSAATRAAGTPDRRPKAKCSRQVEITLLAPEQTGQHCRSMRRSSALAAQGMDRVVELVGFRLSRGYDLIHEREGKPFGRSIGESKAKDHRAAGARNRVEPKMDRGLGPTSSGLMQRLAVNDVAVKCVLDVCPRATDDRDRIPAKALVSLSVKSSCPPGARSRVKLSIR